MKTRPAPGGSGKQLSYIDARFVFDRLDEAVGAANWRNLFERDSKGALRCGLGILVERDGGEAEWVWKWDTGTESNIESNKGEHSDAIKRAGVLWGIARDLYEERGPTPAGAGSRTSSPSASTASSPSTTLYSSWTCPVHGHYRVIPAGTSKKTGRPYPAFAVCDTPGCEEKPPRGHKLTSEAPKPKGFVGMADDLDDEDPAF